MGCSYLVAAGAHLFRLEGRDYVAVLNLFHRTTPWPLKISGRMLTENAAPRMKFVQFQKGFFKLYLLSSLILIQSFHRVCLKENLKKL